MAIQNNISVATEADEKRPDQWKKIGDKEILYSAVMEYSVLIRNLRTCGSSSAYQFELLKTF